MTERCLKHKIFIGVSGCPICKEIAEIRTDFEMKIVDKNLEIIELKKQLSQSKELTPELKQAIHYLSRNEKPIFTNLFAAESIIASCWDLHLQIPEKRRAELKPFIDRIMGFCDDLNTFNQALAEKASKAMGNAEYNDMIVETIRVLDTASGKVKNCHTCIHALDHKASIKKELEKQNKA